MLPQFTKDGYLSVGVHHCSLEEFGNRFGWTPRRTWLWERFDALIKHAGAGGKLRRVFVWGSFVTAEPSPRDVDVFLLMAEDFEVQDIPSLDRAVFDAVRAKLLFNADVSWARVYWRFNIGTMARCVSDFQELCETRYRRAGVVMIKTDEQMQLAEQCVANLRHVLMEARRVHSPEDYSRLATPILIELQQREQEILQYLSSGVEQSAAS